MFYHNFQLIVTASFNLPIPNILLIVIKICIKCTLHNDLKKCNRSKYSLLFFKYSSPNAAIWNTMKTFLSALINPEYEQLIFSSLPR